MAKKPYSFKTDSVADKEIEEMLSVAYNRTDLIRNALFHYFVEISKGNVIDRELPLGWGLDRIPVSQYTYKKMEQVNNFEHMAEHDEPEDDVYDEEYEDDEVEQEEEYKNVDVDVLF